MQRQKFGLTATRHGMSREQKEAFRNLLKDQIGILHHGMCVGGDVDGHIIARKLGYWIVAHPPFETRLMARLECDEYRQPQGYLPRNRNIVNEIDFLIACPYEPEEQPGGGTWSTYRYAKSIQRPVALILPNGIIHAFR